MPARGFTLLEVMVALAVIATALAAIVSAVGSTAGNTAYLRDRTVAQWVAANTLNRAQLEQPVIALGVSSGNETQLGVDWRWQMTVSETPDDNVRLIRVEVRRDAATAGDTLASLSGYTSNRSRQTP